MNILNQSIDMLEGAALWVDVELPFKATLHPGHPRVMVVMGENCTGKSFFVETLRTWASAQGVVSICVSIRERTGAGSYDGGMRRTMMFGDESEHSTGATSVGVVNRAFDNMKNRHDEGHKCLLVLDEPELGLSEGYSAAMGTWLARLARDLPESSAGVVFVTHSRALVRALTEELGQPPTTVGLGTPRDLSSWLRAPEIKTVSQLLSLSATDREGWLGVRAALEQVRKQSADIEKGDA